MQRSSQTRQRTFALVPAPHKLTSDGTKNISEQLPRWRPRFGTCEDDWPDVRPPQGDCNGFALPSVGQRHVHLRAQMATTDEELKQRIKFPAADHEFDLQRSHATPLPLPGVRVQRHERSTCVAPHVIWQELCFPPGPTDNALRLKFGLRLQSATGYEAQRRPAGGDEVRQKRKSHNSWRGGSQRRKGCSRTGERLRQWGLCSVREESGPPTRWHRSPSSNSGSARPASPSDQWKTQND